MVIVSQWKERYNHNHKISRDGRTLWGISLWSKLEEIQTLRLLLKILEDYTMDWSQWLTSVENVALRTELVMWKTLGCHLGKLIRDEWNYADCKIKMNLNSHRFLQSGIFTVLHWILNGWCRNVYKINSSQYLPFLRIRKMSRLPLKAKRSYRGEL